VSKIHTKYFSFVRYRFLQWWGVLLFIGIISSTSSAQKTTNDKVDSLKNVLKNQKDDTNKVNTLIILSNNLENISNYDSSLSYAEKAQTLSEKIGFKKRLANIFKSIGNIYFSIGNYSMALEYHSKSLELSQQMRNKGGIASSFNNIGNIYGAIGNYPKALEYFLKALLISEKIGSKDYIADNFNNIGNIYFALGNYSKAIEYDSNALIFYQDIKDMEGISTSLNNIGSIYGALQNYPQALEYFLKVLSLAREIDDKHDISFAMGNIGQLYSKQGECPKALEYDFNALNEAKTIGEKIEIALMYSKIGELYIQVKNYKQAKIFIDSAINLSKSIGDKENIRNAYWKLVILDTATGNYKMSYEDYTQYITYRDSIINLESVKKITQMEVTYKFEKREDSISVEQEKVGIIKAAEIKRKTIITDSAVVIAILTFLFAILLINRQQIKRKNDKLIFEKEKLQMESELANAKIMLGEYIKNMMEKNKLLEQFKTDTEELKNFKSKEAEENRIEHLEHLNKTTILTEEDWNKFKDLFEQAYKGFFIRMKEKLPDLTKSEIRLICLTKLKLDTKEMAGILGVSYTTIEQTRYRLRKKLNLSKEDSLSTLAESV